MIQNRRTMPEGSLRSDLCFEGYESESLAPELVRDYRMIDEILRA